jgi:hypothetical protein
MTLVAEPLWKHPGNPGMIVLSAHAATRPDGRLPLTYGELQEAARRIPELEQQCGHALHDAGAGGGIFGFLPVRPPQPERGRIGLGLFQTRLAPDLPAQPDLITASVEALSAYLRAQPGLRVRMPLPGASDAAPGGDLDVATVTPLLAGLPPQVVICHPGAVLTAPPLDFPGFKALYLQIERLLQNSQGREAIEILLGAGFDLAAAHDQVRAVERLLTEGKTPIRARSLS